MPGNPSLHPIQVSRPLLATLFFTGLITTIVCKLPVQGSFFSWTHILAAATVYVLAAALAHAYSVWLYCKIFLEDHEIPSKLVVYGLWMAVAWLPLFVLLIGQRSAWTAGVPPVSATYAAIFARWVRARSEARAAAVRSCDLDEPEPATPFFSLETSAAGLQDYQPILLTLWPAVAVSLALQFGIGLFATGRFFVAGLFFAVCTSVPIWTYRHKSVAPQPSQEPRFRSFARDFVTAVLFTAIALVPFVANARARAEIGSLIHWQGSHAPPIVRTPSKAPGGHYSGVILFMPPQPHPVIAPHTERSTTASVVAHPKPITIPFDGAYWYYREPDTAPLADAPHIKGDPTKQNIRSTSRVPLSMDAHQSLATPLSADCCRALRVAVTNADARPGSIGIEVILKDSGKQGTTTRSLGYVILPSSQQKFISLNRAPVEESLTFPLRGFHGDFNEIVVRIIPDTGRNLGAAQIAIKNFELVR